MIQATIAIYTTISMLARKSDTKVRSKMVVETTHFEVKVIVTQTGKSRVLSVDT